MLLNHNAGFEFVKKELSKMFKVRMVKALNHGRHLLVEVQKDDSPKYYYFYCLFKHTTMHSFNILFKDFIEKNPEWAGHGESINTEFLEYAKNRAATLLYIYPDMKIYFVESNLIYKFCNKFSLKREQTRENLYSFSDHKEVRNELEYVFPYKLLSRWN